MTYNIDNLIHFLARGEKASPTKQLEILTQIIEQGLRTARTEIKYSDGAYIHNQVICFTDIPLRDCDEHTSIYGKFGIGFKKSFVKRVGGNPARYFLNYHPGQIGQISESRGVLFNALSDQLKFIRLLDGNTNLTASDQDGNVVLSSANLKALRDSLVLSFSFDKEMGDLGPARDGTKENDLYYREREWRIVPSSFSIGSEIAIAEPNSDRYLFRFERNDANVVVVPNEDIRRLVLKYFIKLKEHTDERLRHFGENPLPIINYDDLRQW